MPATHTYPAEIERDEDGRYVVTFPDFGWGATDGATRDRSVGGGQGSAAGTDRHIELSLAGKTRREAGSHHS